MFRHTKNSLTHLILENFRRYGVWSLLLISTMNHELFSVAIKNIIKTLITAYFKAKHLLLLSGKIFDTYVLSRSLINLIHP